MHQRSVTNTATRSLLLSYKRVGPNNQSQVEEQTYNFQVIGVSRSDVIFAENEFLISAATLFLAYQRPAAKKARNPVRFAQQTMHVLQQIPVLTIYCSRISSLKTKRRPLYLKTQSVPRCKHFSSRL